MNVKRLIYTAVQIVAITAVSLLFSKSTIYNLTSIPAMNSSMAGVEFKMSDIYNSITSRMSTPYDSEDVVIVSVDDCSREEITQVLDVIDGCAPAAVGLDIMYKKQKKHDAELVAAIRDCHNLVLPKRINGYENQKDQVLPEEAYFYDDTFKHFGIVNLEAGDLGCPVRNFRPIYEQADSTLAYGMATELVRLGRPEAFERLMKHVEDSSDTLLINYPNVVFETVAGTDLLERPDSLARDIRGKIVLVGKLYDGHDLHLTPVDITMPGVKIQAYIIETILSDRFLVEYPSRDNWKIAMIVCVLFLILNYIALYNFPIVGKMVLRLVQIGCLFLCDIVGILIYYYRSVYVDFMPTFTMIALGFFSYDIWVGIVAIVQNTVRRVRAQKAAKLSDKAK